MCVHVRVAGVCKRDQRACQLSVLADVLCVNEAAAACAWAEVQLLGTEGTAHAFTFDTTFGPLASQEEIYRDVSDVSPSTLPLRLPPSPSPSPFARLDCYS
jgi:hypothetical protein